MLSYGEVLNYFKRQEEDNVGALVPLIEDSSLRHGLVAWKGTPVKIVGVRECDEKTNDREKWEWLWEDVEIDEQKFTILSGGKIQGAKSLLARLIGLRLVYPDGTVNRLANQYLRAIIMEKIEKGSGKPKGRPKQEEGSGKPKDRSKQEGS